MRISAKLRDCRFGRGVAVVGVNGDDMTLRGEDGNTYCELEDHLWAVQGELVDGSIKFLGSVNHGGGIRLNPLYIRENGVWVDIRAD